MDDSRECKAAVTKLDKSEVQAVQRRRKLPVMSEEGSEKITQLAASLGHFLCCKKQKKIQ